MSPLIQMLVLTAAAGACILAGGLLARFENIRPRWLETELRHSVIAFGGGVLVAAVALLALMIGLQNLPEGFNAFRELTADNPASARRTLLLMAGTILLGPLFGLLGWSLGGNHPAVLGSVMLVAAGGILYLLFQDIAPQARLERRWAPTLGAVLGFGLGLLGDLLVR